MTETRPKIRLHVPDALASGLALGLDPNRAHYLRHVMRCRPGDEVALFNGIDGEWRARIDGFGKGWCSLEVLHRLRPQSPAEGPWLLFAPLKRTRIDALVEKTSELGVAVLQPTRTRRTAAARVNLERLRLIAREAAEQSGRLELPELREPRALDRLLEDWPEGRQLIFCDENGGDEASDMASVLVQSPPPAAGWAILIGPEGGFDATERALLGRQPFVRPVRLGPLILRAETAAIAALSLCQALTGTWRREGRRFDNIRRDV